MKRKLVLAGLLLAAPAASQTPTLPDPLFRYSAIELTHYGAVPGQNANLALQRALNDCAAKSRPVHVPTGAYLITATSNWVTSNNNCPGIYGDGPGSIFVPVDFNGAVITATVQAGIPQAGKVIRDLDVQASWSAPSPTHDSSRLINITGAADGWSASRFEHLRGFSVHDIIRIATTSPLVGGLFQSNSGFNTFDGLYGNAGSQSVLPDSLVNYADSTSTGNVFLNFISATASGMIYAGGGAGVMVGDLVIGSGHIGQGRVLYVAGGATCASYERSISINNVQVDAASTEVVKAECGFINNIKINGTMGGTAPWAGVNSLSLSDVHDLGEGHWGAGGPMQVGGTTGTHTAIPLWKVTLGAPTNLGATSGYGMSRIEVSVGGVIGGLGGGGVIAVYDCGVSVTLAKCKTVSALNDTNCPDYEPSACPAGWPVINTPSISGNVVTFTSTWTDSTISTLASNIKVDHGAMKVNRTSNGSGGVVY